MTPAGIEPATTFSRNVLAAFVFGLPCIPVMNLGITFCAFNAKTCSISYEYLMFSRYWLLRIAVSWVMKTYRRLHCFVVLHKTTVGIDLFFLLFYFIISFFAQSINMSPQSRGWCAPLIASLSRVSYIFLLTYSKANFIQLGLGACQVCKPQRTTVHFPTLLLVHRIA